MSASSTHIPSAGEWVAPEVLRRLAAEILRHAGMSAEDAQSMAGVLVYAQECGIDSHGLAHLLAYVNGFASGALNPSPQFQLLSTMPGVATLEADQAPGILAGHVASDEAVRRAASVGIGAVAVRNSSHFGAASAFVDRMVARGMVALVLSNASPTVAPRGARTALFGTNPIAAGFPRADGPPVILDLATTAGARGRIRRAAAAGQSIPDHWALDAQGRPTSDANAALQGTMQALGGEKGTALALMVELFCVALSGGNAGRFALTPQEPSGAPRGISHFFIAIDVTALGQADAVAERVSDIARSVETAQPAQEDAAPRMPGGRAAMSRALSQDQGILISENLNRTLQDAYLAAQALRNAALSYAKRPLV